MYANAARSSELRAMGQALIAMAEDVERTDLKRKRCVVENEMAPLDQMVELAGRWHSIRERRSEFFSSALLGEPAWDMLLYLFVQAGQSAPVQKTAVAGASGVAHTTALRYVQVLIQQGLVSEARSSSDNRVSMVSLTQEGRIRMSAYLARALRSRYRSSR